MKLLFPTMKLLFPTAYCFLLLSGGCTTVYAQENFSADRPGFADAPDIVPSANLQIGYGFQWDKTDKVNSFQLPTGTLRYGVSPNLEWRANYALPFARNTGLQLAPLEFGMKVNMLEEQKFVPKTSGMLFVTPKGIGTPELQARYWGSSFELLVSKTILSKTLFIYNIGATWDGISPASQWNELVSLTYVPSPPLNLSLEVYHEFFEIQMPNWASDVTVSYQLTQSFQVDASAGIDLLHPANYFFNFGATYQYIPSYPKNKLLKASRL
jgi:hypothetical protein